MQIACKLILRSRCEPTHARLINYNIKGAYACVLAASNACVCIHVYVCVCYESSNGSMTEYWK